MIIARISTNQTCNCGHHIYGTYKRLMYHLYIVNIVKRANHLKYRRLSMKLDKKTKTIHVKKNLHVRSKYSCSLKRRGNQNTAQWTIEENAKKKST